MGAEIVEVGLVEEQDLAVEEMKVDSVGIVGKKNIVGKAVGRPIDMFRFHGNILTNFAQVVFGLAEETKYAKA